MKRVKDLHILPKFDDGWSYLYVEHSKIDKEAGGIALHDARGRVPVPCANLAVIMLGPGVSITHAAVSTLVDVGCTIAWCGESGVRLYATGMGKTRSAANLLHQARMWADEKLRMKVVRNLYQIRFPEQLGPELTIKQIRGMEGIRVRQAYARWSKATGVPWKGRRYRSDRWSEADPINKALSAANSCLYGLCHAAVLAAGFSPAIGFIHTGKMLSFIYDIADIYKTEVTFPVAFQTVAEGDAQVERRTRHTCRDMFSERKLMKRIIPDIKSVLEMGGEDEAASEYDRDPALPGHLWDPDGERVEGGRSYYLDRLDSEEGNGCSGPRKC